MTTVAASATTTATPLGAAVPSWSSRSSRVRGGSA